MFSYGRYALLSVVLLVIGYFSWRAQLYFFDTTTPEISLVGVDQGAYYAGNVQATVVGSSPYKVATLSVKLDDIVVAKDIKINKKKFSYPLNFAQESLSQGQHVIQLDIVDGTKQQNKAHLEKTFNVDNLPLQATFVSSKNDYRVLQGRCLWVQFQVNKPIAQAHVKALSSEYVCYQKNKNSMIYECFIPTECEQVVQEYPFSLEIKDHIGNKVILDEVFHVLSGNFKKVILNVPNNKLKSELEFTSLQERDLEEALEKITQDSVKEKLWSGSFEIPITMTTISTDFGVIRTSQERGRTVHRALDLVGPLKGVVWASQSGIIVLKDRFTHSGNTVVIDHGYGLLSLYFHLHDFADISVGQKIKKGNPLGHMGMTGFANGHHLHWEIRLNNIAVDPMQWTHFA